MKFLKILLSLFFIVAISFSGSSEIFHTEKDVKSGKVGFKNEKDKWAIKPKYLDATNFFYPYKKAPEKIAFVSSEPGKVQIINKSGKILVEFESTESNMENFRDRISKNPLYEKPYMFTEIPIGNGLHKLLGIYKDEYDLFESTFGEIYPLFKSNPSPYDFNQGFLKKTNGKFDYFSFEINPSAIYEKKDPNKRRIKVEEKKTYSKFNDRYLDEIRFRELEPGIILAEYGSFDDSFSSPETSLIVDGKYSAWRKFVDYQNDIKVFEIPDLSYYLVFFNGHLIPLLKESYSWGGNIDRNWIAGTTPDNKFIFGIKSEHGRSEKLLDIEADGEYEAIRPHIDYDNIKVEQKNGDKFFLVNLDKGAIINPFKMEEEADAILNQSGEKDYIKALKLYLDATDYLKAFPETKNKIYNKIVENIIKECNDKAAIIKTVKSYEPSEFINTTIYRYNTWGPGYIFPNKSGSNDLFSSDGKLLVSGDRYDSFVKFNQYNKNLIIFKKDGKYGAFNLNGNQVIAPTHTEFGGDNSAKKRFCFRDRLANGADKYFVYDDNGKLLAQEVFTDPKSPITERRILNFLSTWM